MKNTQQQWKSDEEWWQMLRLAQAGDVIFASVGNRGLAGYYHFLGEGQTALSGIAHSISAISILDDYSLIPSVDLDQLFSGAQGIVWGGLFTTDANGNIVDVLHRMSVTNSYVAGDLSTSLLAYFGSTIREAASTVLPEALCSPVGGFATGVGCETLMGYTTETVAPTVLIGPDFAISPEGVSAGDTIYVSAGHVFRYDPGGLILGTTRHSRLDMYYYGNSSLYSYYHLIINYTQ